MSETLLLPCPFCGAQPTHEVFSDSRYPHEIYCGDCIGLAGTQQKTFEEAAAVWNHRAPQPAPAAGGVPQLTVKEYLLREYGPDADEIVLIRMVQRDDVVKWAILRGNSTLNREGVWEYQPSSSERDATYLARCRFDSVDEALQHWQNWLAQQRPPAQEPPTP